MFDRDWDALGHVLAAVYAGGRNAREWEALLGIFCREMLVDVWPGITVRET